MALDGRKDDTEATTLALSDEKYRLFADATEEGVVIHDYQRILAANNYFCRMFGYSPEQAENLSPFDFIAPETRASIMAFPRDDRDTSGEASGIRADGIVFPIEIKARTVTYQGRPARIARVRDLTKRRAAEATLNASEERFRATFEQAAVGIAHVALDGTWLRVNQRLCEIIGYDHDELLKLTFQDVTHPDDLSADLDQLTALIAGALGRYSMEKRYYRKDHSIVWVNLTVAMVKDAVGNPSYFISILEDITARKLMEETLRQSQKMDVVGQLTSSIAHDFGNYLNVIKGNLELIKIFQKDGRPSEYVKSALAGADLAEKLIQQLLSFSRRQAPEFETLDAGELIQGITGLLRKAVTSSIKLTIEIEERQFWTVCDRIQLETALFNLVLNARDAIGQKKGAIGVRTSVQAVTEPGNGQAAGDYVRIEVSDNGHGMPPEIAAHAQDPFFTTKGIGEGTGLGLSQVARAVAQMNGFMTIESTENVGTSIVLFIPLKIAG